jgi:hypothetical protein
MKVENLLKELASLKTGLYGKDFLLTWENSLDNLKAVMLVAEIMQELHRAKKPFKIFDSGLG